jgi:hypothetical protein
MATQATVTLDSLHCTLESDEAGHSHSEPYVWPFLAIISSNTFDTTPTAASLSDSRRVLQNEMRAGDTATIPYPLNTLSATFEDDQTDRQLILVVGLFEQDDTPIKAVQAGYQAFLDELHKALGSNLLRLHNASPDDVQVIIDEIKQQVYAKVYAAVENHLSAWEKTQVYFGWLNPDDFMGSDFKWFQSLTATSFTLTLKGSSGDLIVTLPTTAGGTATAVNPPVQYEISGRLAVQPVTVNRCQSEIDAVSAAQAALQGLENLVQSLQLQLQHATPQEKAGIVAEIKHVTTDLIPPAQAALDSAQQALILCRGRHHPVPDRPAVGPAVA